MDRLKIGIIGTGRIASVLAETMVRMPQVELYGAASRTLKKAEEFSKRYGIKRLMEAMRNLLWTRI